MDFIFDCVCLWILLCGFMDFVILFCGILPCGFMDVVFDFVLLLWIILWILFCGFMDFVFDVCWFVEFVDFCLMLQLR